MASVVDGLPRRIDEGRLHRKPDAAGAMVPRLSSSNYTVSTIQTSLAIAVLDSRLIGLIDEPDRNLHRIFALWLCSELVPVTLLLQSEFSNGGCHGIRIRLWSRKERR